MQILESCLLFAIIQPRLRSVGAGASWVSAGAYHRAKVSRTASPRTTN